MRARLALDVAANPVELREIVLRDKAQELLSASPKGTVPVLVLPEGEVIDESLDVMAWALAQNDPEGWTREVQADHALIAACDGPFKRALDRTKYHSRYDSDPESEREIAYGFLAQLQDMLSRHAFLLGAAPSLVDMAILPFVRQFAFIDRQRFDRDVGGAVVGWLDRFLASDRFARIMVKYDKWNAGDAPLYFPQGAGQI